MPPKRPDLVLPPDVPHIELDVLEGDRLDVEADRWDRSHLLLGFQFVEDGLNTRDQLAIGKVRFKIEQRNVGAPSIILVFPAASRPSIRRRISVEPKILPNILEN